MPETALAMRSTFDAAIAEQVLVGGDLSKLTPAQATSYVIAVCDSLGLNWKTRPLEFIILNGKKTLYARKDATDQLRAIHKISIDKPDIRFEDQWIIVAVSARNAEGRSDADIGVVNKSDMRGDFGNALMKAVTKAKRRVTLSICGLGMLDESEIDSIPDARPVPVDVTTGDVLPATAVPPAPAPTPQPVPVDGRTITEKQQKRLFAIARETGWQTSELKEWLTAEYGIGHTSEIAVTDYDAIVDAVKNGTTTPSDTAPPLEDSPF